MLKTYEIMTHELVTCAPDTSIAEVAAIMRDHDIGDVLIVENGKLRGIVTDRDLALQALTGNDNPLETPIRKFMSTKVVTGEASASLEHAARRMAKHQVRRLPIVQDGKLVGIISLGDVARYEDHKDVVKDSLQAISTPTGISVPKKSARSGALFGFTLAATAATLAWLNWSETGQELRKQFTDNKFYNKSRQIISSAFEIIDDVATNKLPDLGHQLRSNIEEVAAQIPTLEYKTAQRNHNHLN